MQIYFQHYKIQKGTPTFHYPISGVYDHVSVRHLPSQWMSPGERVSPSSQKKRFIVGVCSRWRDAVGAVASLGCVSSVSHRRRWGRCCCLERVEEDASAETVVRGRMELMGWGREREREEREIYSGDPFNALHHPDMAKRGTPTHRREGPA